MLTADMRSPGVLGQLAKQSVWQEQQVMLQPFSIKKKRRMSESPAQLVHHLEELAEGAMV